MSGGVDSSVAAARLVRAGHDVTGVHLALARQPEALRAGSRGCCSVEDSDDARRVAETLGIPFYVWDFSERFTAEVIDDFVDSYARGETPNPCLRCNEKIKFEAVLERALALGFDAVATGHYAIRDEQGRLRRSPDKAKDQSYVLGVLDRHQLAHSVFPVGDTEKRIIRAEAAAQGLGAVAAKPDSHDICFIPTGKTQVFLGSKLGVRSGAIVDAVTGETLGEHAGVHEYTIGQRKGLGLTVPTADGSPRFVTDINAATGEVRVGPRSALSIGQITADRGKWLVDTPIPDHFDANVQVRAHGEVVPATVTRTGGSGLDEDTAMISFTVALHAPIQGVAKGQAVVIYDPHPGDDRGDIVLGSATICDTTPWADEARPAAAADRA